MSEKAKPDIHERIRYHTQEQLALFAAFLLLVGWLGGRAEAEIFDMMFWLGLGGAVGILGAVARLRWMVQKLIKQLEAQP